jgi:ketosteroid isomerase-like protein
MITACGSNGFLSDPLGSLAGMSGTEHAAGAGRVVADYWAAAEARDWGAFGALLAEDVVYEIPQTRERVRGRDAYVRFNAEGFPGDWHLAVQRIVSQDRTAVSMIEFSEAGASQTGLCFFDLDAAGRIVRIADFWPDPYEPPAARAHLVVRY